jgi:hypothetical protein
MTPGEHWREADLIMSGDPCEYGCPHSGCQDEMRMIARAQVHAVLALAAGPLGISIGEEVADAPTHQVRR